MRGLKASFYQLDLAGSLEESYPPNAEQAVFFPSEINIDAFIVKCFVSHFCARVF